MNGKLNPWHWILLAIPIPPRNPWASDRIYLHLTSSRPVIPFFIISCTSWNWVWYLGQAFRWIKSRHLGLTTDPVVPLFDSHCSHFDGRYPSNHRSLYMCIHRWLLFCLPMSNCCAALARTEYCSDNNKHSFCDIEHRERINIRKSRAGRRLVDRSFIASKAVALRQSLPYQQRWRGNHIQYSRKARSRLGWAAKRHQKPNLIQEVINYLWDVHETPRNEAEHRNNKGKHFAKLKKVKTQGGVQERKLQLRSVCECPIFYIHYYR